MKDKKAVSIMIGYVLLVALVIGISGIVYSFLRFYAPANINECYDDVNLAITELKCENNILNITIENRGLFSVDGAFIKIGSEERVLRKTVCLNDPGEQECDVFFGVIQGSDRTDLNPGESFSHSFDYFVKYGEPLNGRNEVEVEPMVFVNNEATFCKNAIIVQDVDCT